MTRETFWNLLAPHMQGVRRLVRNRLRATDEVDDVVQQALLHAFARREQLQAPEKFRNWLWTIALNEIRMLRRQKRVCIAIDEYPNFELTDPAPSPIAIYEQGESVKRVRAGLARLKERDRTAIHLTDFHDLSMEDAARVVGISRPAFKSTHHRARKRLADQLRRAA